MPSVEARIIARLRGYADVGALVGEQVYGGFARAGTPLPYIVVTRISGSPLNTLSGPDSLGDNGCRLQVDCFAGKYGDVKRIADAVRGALSGYTDSGAGITSCLLDNEIDDTDEPTDASNVVTQRVIQDYIVFYK